MEAKTAYLALIHKMLSLTMLSEAGCSTGGTPKMPSTKKELLGSDSEKRIIFVFDLSINRIYLEHINGMSLSPICHFKL